MENVSKALVLAIQYLGVERNDDEYTEEDDLKIVEESASLVQSATEEEKATLVRVSKELGLEDWAHHIGIE
jgi:hypothetical protein